MDVQTQSSLVISQIRQTASKTSHWTEEEDNKLISTYQNSQGESSTSEIDFEDDVVWDKVASALSPHSAVQCLLRYIKLTSATMKNKRDHDDVISPSLASFGSNSSQKKLKRVESCDDWTEKETEHLSEVMMQYQDKCECCCISYASSHRTPRSITQF